MVHLKGRNPWLVCLAGWMIVAPLIFVLIKTINGQEEGDFEWPVVFDPFPDSDEIGPEEPPPSPDCSLACQERVDEAFTQIGYLQEQLALANATLLAKLMELGGSGDNGAILQRISDLEYYLSGNITFLMNKIDTDVGNLRNQLSGEISTAKQELNYKIDNLPQGGGGGTDEAKINELYYNLTSRIDSLENGKIKTLITDNGLWRQNFRVVNATFAKLRKSTNGNNVVITG